MCQLSGTAPSASWSACLTERCKDCVRPCRARSASLGSQEAAPGQLCLQTRDRQQPGPSAVQASSPFLFQSSWGRERHLFRPLQCLIITTKLSCLPPPSSACSLPAGSSSLPSASDGGHEKLTQHPERRKHQSREGHRSQMTSRPRPAGTRRAT